MDIKEAIYTRRSVRAYKDQPVGKELIEQVIDAAIHAPSGMNGQPWAFAVITDKQALQSLSDKTKAFLVANLDKFPFLSGYLEMLQNPDYHALYNAPAMVLILAKPNTGQIAQVDCTLAAQNLMLMARSLGLGACWIGFAAMYLGVSENKREFGIPEDYAVVAPIILGYPSVEFSQMDRTPAEVIWA